MSALTMDKKVLCEYGCGNEAKYFLKRAKKWCCSKSYNSCPIAKEKNRKSHVGELNHRYGKKNTEEQKTKVSEANKGKTPWNKGKTGVYSKETLKAMGDSRRGIPSWNKGISLSDETKNKISLSLIGNKPWNKGIPHSEETKQKISSINKGKIRDEKFKSGVSKRVRGNRNPKWKGGYHSSGIPTYDRYVNQLTIEEKPERDLIDQNILTVICSNCKKRFIPKLDDVSERVRCLKGTQNGECRLYCSEECKNLCSVFNKKIHQEGHPKNKPYTIEEYKQFREFVLNRDDYKCQYCGKKAEHVHHERPQKLEPFFSLDPDFAWSVCKECHYKYGHKDECSTSYIANIIC